MKRTPILIPVLAAFLAGAIVGGRLLSADAQPAPATPAAPCETKLARRDAELRRAKNAAEANQAAAMTRIRELEKLLAVERARRKKLEQHLSAPGPGLD